MVGCGVAGKLDSSTDYFLVAGWIPVELFWFSETKGTVRITGTHDA